MRAMSAPALMSYRATRNPRGFKGPVFSRLASRWVSSALVLAAVGEMVADKLPFLPNRIDPLPLLGRAQWGGFAGAAAFAEAERSALVGAAIAGVAAVASAFAWFNVRRMATQTLGLPDPVVALAEDAVVLALGRGVLSTYE